MFIFILFDIQIIVLSLLRQPITTTYQETILLKHSASFFCFHVTLLHSYTLTLYTLTLLHSDIHTHYYNLTFLHSYTLTLLHSYTLTLLHSYILTLFRSFIILYSNTLTLLHSYTLTLLYLKKCDQQPTNQQLSNNVDIRDPIGSKCR